MRILLLASALLLAAPAPAFATEVAGTASVIDGDTIELRGQRIRLHGIDAPENRQRCIRGGREWRCATEAANALSDLIGRSPVTCELLDIDRYQRAVARCLVRGIDVGRWMVAEGWAMAYQQYSRDYIREERRARAAGRGIWAGEVQPPWEWRRDQRRR